MIKIYFLAVVIALSCTPTKKPQIAGPVRISIDSSGASKVTTIYLDSTRTVINLNKDGELLDSTFYHKP